MNWLTTGYTLSKWNNSISATCVVCNEIDSPNHLLFSCKRINDIWKTVGTILKLDIKWCHIVLGLTENNDLILNKARNNILTIIAYAIYKSLVVIDDNKSNYKYNNILQNNLLLFMLIYIARFYMTKNGLKFLNL